MVVSEAGSSEALKVLELASELVAPDIICAELTNIFHKKLILGQMTFEQAVLGIQSIAAEIRCIPNNVDLCADALRLAQKLKHSAYDCLYLALALSGGILVTSDGVFGRKCQDSGFELFVATPEDITSFQARLHPRFTISPNTLQDIDRLAIRVEQTMQTLTSLSGESSGSSGLQFVSATAISPAFDVPAYRRLAELLASLDREQLEFLLALGWLGRSYHHARDWLSLIENARFLAGEGFDRHAPYFMAQMTNVSAGLRKLKQYDWPGPSPKS